jgi:hypothetical protein
MRYFILFIFSSLFLLRKSVEGLATNNVNTLIEIAPLEEHNSNNDVQIPEAEDDDDEELSNDFNLLNVSQKYIENRTYVKGIPEAENEDDTNFGNDEPTFQNSNSEAVSTVLDEAQGAKTNFLTQPRAGILTPLICLIPSVIPQKIFPFTPIVSKSIPIDSFR